MLERLELLIPKAIPIIKELHVLIIGLGGVGGYALESIVRSGIKEVTIIDGDKITTSNLNRQIIATRKTIGQYKTDAFELRLKEINPDLIIHKITRHLTPLDIDEVITPNIDYVVDCCDTISVKEAIIKRTLALKIKLISSMGTGNKLSPERLKIMKLKDTNYDPLAKRLRKFIKEEQIKEDIYVVSSDEEKVVDDYKAIPSNSFVPATAGLLCTSYIINYVVSRCV